MSKHSPASRCEIRLLMTLHLLVTLMSPLFLTTMTGCLEEKLQESPPKLGKQNSVEQVQKAIDDAMAGRDPGAMRIGDWAAYEENFRVDLGATIKIAKIHMEIVDQKEDAEKVRYVLEERFIDYSEDEPKETVSQRVIDLVKLNLPEIPEVPIDDENHPMSVTRLKALGEGRERVSEWLEPQEDRTTFHGLNIKKYRMDSPGDCSSFPDCQLDVTEIRVNIVNWTGEKDFEKTEVRWVISAQTPWFAPTAFMCQNRYVEAERRRFFVNQCQVLRDFGFATP